MIFKKLWPFKSDWQNKTWEVYGLLGNKFNGDFLEETTIKSFADKIEYRQTTRSMYKSTEKRYGYTYYAVGEWPKTVLYEKLVYNEFGANEELKSFYYPLHLLAQDAEFLEALGPPAKVHQGIMLTSGRSLLVVTEDTKPFILKVGTYRYSNLKNFSMRFLTVRNILNCLQITPLAKKSHAVFAEAAGGAVYVMKSPKLYEQDSLTYLIRTLDFERYSIGSDTALLPLTAVLSKNFWEVKELLKSLNLSPAKADLLFASLAEKLADSICTSLTESHLHFMAHQQNLSIAVRENRTTALIYHDLQDTLLDSVSYVIDQLQKKGLSRIEEIYCALFQLARHSDHNLNSQMLVPGGSISGYDVLSYYLRFYKYLPQYDKYFARLSDVKNLFEFMAERIFNDTRLDAVRESLSGPSAGRSNLFWLIDRAHYYLECHKIKALQQSLDFSKLARLSAEELTALFVRARVIVSRDFPYHLTDVDVNKIEAAYDLFSKKIIFVVYDKKPCLLLLFQGTV